MSKTLAILNPGTLLGKELGSGLGDLQGVWGDLRLLSEDPESFGTLAESGGQPGFVQDLTEESLDGVDLLVRCPQNGALGTFGPPPTGPGAVLDISPAEMLDTAMPLVAGVNLRAPVQERHLVSPHPVVIHLAHMLQPLQDLGVLDVAANFVQPTSARETAGISELFAQTRSILTFSERMPDTVFRRQLAFNLLPTETDPEPLLQQLDGVLGASTSADFQLLQGGIFHSLSLSLSVRLERDPGEKSVRQRLEQQPHITMAPDPDWLGPIDAAASEDILVGHIRRSGRREGAYWIWSVMDNLTRGGAANAVEIVSAVLA